MIDTVTIFSPGELLQFNPPPGWNHSNSHTEIDDPDGVGRIRKGSFNYDHTKTGYHGHGHTYEIRYHRASLPRLIHGHNGKLIDSQIQLDAALDLLQQTASQICNASFNVFYFTRVDLVWQFRGDAADYILAHRNARHPRIHRGPSFYEARSMAFTGSELRVAMYDKTLQQFNDNGGIVRVEVQLKGRILKELLGDGERVTKLDFAKCYRAYRQILTGFVPSKITGVGSIAHLLAVGERSGWTSDGISAFDLYTQNRSPRQVHRIKRDMASFRPSVHGIDWTQLLPIDGPPEPVELGE